MTAKIWFLFNSGFAVQTERHFLIFDYWRNTPKKAGLEGGVVDPAALRDLDVVVFSSHSHGDHYNDDIFSWHTLIPKLRIILSSDFRKREGAVLIKPGNSLEMPDMRIDTLISNDKGLAYIVETDGLRIYHAGDLNWWHWEGEPDDFNAKMADRYKKQIDLLKGKTLDLAFVPVDPRLEEQYAWGIGYLMQTADVRHVVPMHFFDRYAVVEQLMKDPASEPYRDRIIPLARRGQSAEI